MAIRRMEKDMAGNRLTNTGDEPNQNNSGNSFGIGIFRSSQVGSLSRLKGGGQSSTVYNQSKNKADERQAHISSNLEENGQQLKRKMGNTQNSLQKFQSLLRKKEATPKLSTKSPNARATNKVDERPATKN